MTHQIFAEAECVIIRVIHKKTYRIHEFIVRLSLFTESLDGATLAAHVVEVLCGESGDNQDKGLDKRLADLRAISIDRASTNKRAKDILEEDHGINPMASFCFAHGTANCGKKEKPEVAGEVIKQYSRMVKFRLCKARNIFKSTFGEPARRVAGVRWCQRIEVAEQMNRIGLDRLRDEYAVVCATNNWSGISAQKFLDSIEDHQDFWKASCEIAAIVDVGTPLASETYTSEMKLNGALVHHESIEHLHNLFAQGVAGFDRLGAFVELEKRAHEADAYIRDTYLVSTCYPALQ